MPDGNGNGTTPKISTNFFFDFSGWMSDVQRAIALILIVSFAVVVIAVTIKLVFSGEVNQLNEMAKTVQAALVNMVLIALGFFFGSNLSKTLADAGQQKIVEKLTGGPTPPASPPKVVVSWWSLMTPQEQAAIKDAADKGDPKTLEVWTSLQAGKAVKEDLDYLVSVNLLTKERVDVLTSAS